MMVKIEIDVFETYGGWVACDRHAREIQSGGHETKDQAVVVWLQTHGRERALIYLEVQEMEHKMPSHDGLMRVSDDQNLVEPPEDFVFDPATATEDDQ